MTQKVELYDTTLRDGTQSEDISLTTDDKVKIAHKLDELGIHYIEGGWPGSNPKDADFFEKIKKHSFETARITAFGSTCRAEVPPERDENVRALLAAETPVITIFGKSWDIHPINAMNITLEQNLDIIYESLKYLKSKVDTLIYDAEHFFDGYKNNREYAMKTLAAAAAAQPDCIVLCDTNGGCLPHEIEEIVQEVKSEVEIPLGIHCHNDSDTAVANSFAAIRAGVIHVQGTINGFGERCGNANLCSIIPNLVLKLGIPCIDEERLKNLVRVSRYVNELANIVHDKHQPYVGASAFAHKGGVHVAAIRKDPTTYEHIPPEKVGNRQRVLVSDLSGASNVLYKAKEFGIDLSSKDAKVRDIVNKLKELENRGYQFEGAEASFELLMKEALGNREKFFELMGYRVIDERKSSKNPPFSEATIMIRVKDSIEHTAAIGNGPVNALDNALRKALERFYPELKELKLKDYKVRVLAGEAGTAAVTRVLIESGDKDSRWGTVGVSENIIQASWDALIDSIEYKLQKEKERQTS